MLHDRDSKKHRVDQGTGFGDYIYVVTESNDETAGRVRFITKSNDVARYTVQLRKRTLDGSKPSVRITVLKLPMCQMLDLDVVDAGIFVYGVWTE